MCLPLPWCFFLCSSLQDEGLSVVRLSCHRHETQCGIFDASLCLTPRQSTDVDHLIKVTDSNVRRDTERRIVQQTQHAIEIEALGADSHASQE